MLAGIAAFAAGPPLEEGRSLSMAIVRKLRYAPQLPGPCWRDPLTEAHGRSWPDWFASSPRRPLPARPGRDPLIGVDFRYCRRPSCAVPLDSHLTASNRRSTAFTSAEDHRRAGTTPRRPRIKRRGARQEIAD